MTKEQFITAIEAKQNFIKWAVEPSNQETNGDIEKWHGKAYITRPNGKQVFDVWFLVDTATNEADWQEQDSLEPDERVDAKKLTALENYLDSEFNAYFIERVDFNKNWAEATTYSLAAGKLEKKAVLVFKQGSNPINHLEIV